ncbi:MAG: DNA repair protein RecN, partial [Gammaproteobacteria bacterium]
MLTELHIRNIAIARSASVEPGPGFTVITGETGAGKSILLDALGLVLGDRADSDMIRHGEDKADISAGFELASDEPARQWLQDNDLDEDGEVLLRRVIHRDRASKGYINGRPASMTMLRELGEQLVDIHGQHAHQSLLKSASQRHIVDQYAGLEEAVARLTGLYQTISQLKQRIADMQQASAQQAAQLELLQFQVSELESADIGENEIEQLDEEHKKLANASKLLEGAQSALWSLYDADEGSVTTTLSQTVATLQELAQYDAALQGPAALLAQAQIELDESVAEIRSYQDRLELDPSRLQWVEQRLQTLMDLSRKHRVEARELPARLAEMKQQLDDIENADANVEALQQQLTDLEAQYDRLADEISAGRRQAAAELTEKVTEEIHKLGLGDGQLIV